MVVVIINTQKCVPCSTIAQATVQEQRKIFATHELSQMIASEKNSSICVRGVQVRSSVA